MEMPTTAAATDHKRKEPESNGGGEQGEDQSMPATANKQKKICCSLAEALGLHGRIDGEAFDEVVGWLDEQLDCDLKIVQDTDTTDTASPSAEEEESYDTYGRSSYDDDQCPYLSSPPLFVNGVDGNGESCGTCFSSSGATVMAMATFDDYSCYCDRERRYWPFVLFGVFGKGSCSNIIQRATMLAYLFRYFLLS